MIKNAIKAVTLYTMTGLTIRRPTISKKPASAGFLQLYSHVFLSATDGCRCPTTPLRP